LLEVNGSRYINSDLRPIAYFYTLRLWDMASSNPSPALFKFLRSITVSKGLLTVVAIVVAGLLLIFISTVLKKNFHLNFSILFAIFTTGLSTMMYQVALIFSFQSIYGFVYEMIGLLIAIFMGGLSIGSSISNRFISKKSNIKILALLELMVALFAVVMAITINSVVDIKIPWVIFLLFCLITLISGIFDGADFPVAAECYNSIRPLPERSAGSIYGMELIGGCTGAVITSTAIVPIVGIIWACLKG
jgi:spermidine synthase